MALSFTHYRFGSVDGTESTHGWLAGIDRDIIRLPGAPGAFLLRGTLQETAGVAENNVAGDVRYRLNGGAWIIVTTTSAVVRTGANAVYANNANTTKRLTGTGTFESSSQGCTTDGTFGGTAMDIVASGNAEFLIGLQIINADVAVGDLIEFAVFVSGVIVPASVTPAVRVSTEVLPIQSRDTSVHNSITVGVTKISGTLVSVECIGMSGTDLADPDLSMTMSVWGTTVVGSTDPADYTISLYGPDVWSGGGTGKDGLPIEPGFGFAQDIPEGVRRVMATFVPSRTTTFGAQATIVE